MEYTRKDRHFLYFCQKGNVSELCYLLINYTPSCDVLHKGVEYSILCKKPNTLNFLIEQFEVDPHHNNNYFFLLCLCMIKSLDESDNKKSKTLGNKLLKSKLFDKEEFKKYVFKFVQEKEISQNHFYMKLYNHPFSKFLPKHLVDFDNYFPDNSFYSEFTDYFKKEKILDILVDF